MSKHKEERGAKRENETPIENKQATAHGLAEVTLLCPVPCPGSRSDPSSGDSHSQGHFQCTTSIKIDCICRSGREKDASCDIGAGGIKHGASSPGMAA